MGIENFIAEFKKTFVYDILSQTLSDEQLFERVVDGDAVLWFKEQTRQMWLMWEKAKAVPDLSELQERIAGHQYYHDEHGHMIVDMDDVVKEISGFDSWKAQAVPEGFVLIKDDTKTVVAIERMVEQQVEASGMDSRRLERLDGWKIIEAAVKAQEPAND